MSVSLLGGFYSAGGARVWRVIPGHGPTVWARGLTTVQGCGFGKDGAFYATEFQVGGLNEGPTANPAGDVVRIGRNGKRTHLGVGKLFFPLRLRRGNPTARSTSPTAASPRPQAWVRSCARPVVRWSAYSNNLRSRG